MAVNLIIGGSGLLGKALRLRLDCVAPSRSEFDLRGGDLSVLPDCDTAYLCAGIRYFQKCEGSASVFQADVDGNLRVARHFLKRGTFVVFVSSDAVENMAHTAYGRNRLLVEMSLIMQPNVAIIRASRFTEETVGKLADFIIGVGRTQGLHYWRDDGL